MRRFRLVATGKFGGTRLYDADTGEEIPNCCGARVEITQDNNYIPRVWLEFVNLDLDLIAEEATTPEEQS